MVVGNKDVFSIDMFELISFLIKMKLVVQKLTWMDFLLLVCVLAPFFNLPTVEYIFTPVCWVHVDDDEEEDENDDNDDDDTNYNNLMVLR
jgi:hypothetical protein